MADPNLTRPSQQCVGGRVLDAEGPFRDVRERAMHMFYLYDNPDYRKARLNPLRRLWQAPGEAFERVLRPALGLKHANTVKFMAGKALWGIGAVWAVTYYAYFNSGNWSKHGGWRVHTSKPSTMPDNPNYPKKDPRWEMKYDDYNDLGFKAGGAALMPSIVLNPHAPAEVPARDWRN